MIGTNRYIGSPVERIEDLRFLRGRGEFVGDLKRDSMLHAAILRSPVAHGRVTAVDASAALAIAGVRAVITAKDIKAVPRIPLRLLPLPGTEQIGEQSAPQKSGPKLPDSALRSTTLLAILRSLAGRGYGPGEETSASRTTRRSVQLFGPTRLRSLRLLNSLPFAHCVMDSGRETWRE